MRTLPQDLWLFALAVLLGALSGSRLGIVGFDNQTTPLARGCGLLLAGLRLISAY